MHKPLIRKSGNGKGWDSCRNPVNVVRTIGHGLQDKFLARNLKSGQALLGCPATHILGKRGLTATDDLAPMDLASEGKSAKAAQEITLHTIRYTQNKGLNSSSKHYHNKPLHIQSRDFKSSGVSSRHGSTA